jgi:hypothetical protein
MMLRFLYRGLLGLHPPAFRKRFGEEMQSIFDQGEDYSLRFRLLADGVLSLLRQWSIRGEFWHEIASETRPLASDGVPSFQLLDPFRPRGTAVVHGLVATLVVFSLTGVAIRYSWIHVLHVRIPEMRAESHARIKPEILRPEAQPPTSKPPTQRAANLAGSSFASQDTHAQTAPTPAQTDAPKTEERLGATRTVSGYRGANKLSTVGPNLSGAKQIARVPQLDFQGIAKPVWFRAMPQAQPAAAASTAAPDEKIDAQERHRVIQAAAANLTRYYVDAELAQRVAVAIQAHEKRGEDDGATDGEGFANLVTQQMQAVTHDPYLMLVYGAAAPLEPPRPSPADVNAYRREMEKTNCGFGTVRVLPHNVGYWKFNSFPDADICGSRAAAAMAKLNDVDAIIFDLRDNGGGYSNMVAFIATYLFDRPTHLNDFYNRAENTNEESWTLAPVPGNKLTEKPAFVLTSHRTFSAAEGFGYDLKMLERATLVGETTSGQGHPARGRQIDDRFMIRVPDIKVVNPLSKTNWEGTGVKPDVEVQAEDALAIAEKLAERRVRRR